MKRNVKIFMLNGKKYMNDELPGLPMFQGKSITIVNDKVRNLDIEIGTDQSLYNLTKEA